MKSTFVCLMLLFFASSLSASVVDPQTQCPDQFIGKVSAIIEPAVDSALATNKVVVTNLENISGDLGETVFVDILRNGTTKTRVGDHFKISLRRGFLCHIEEFERP